jgi:predicted unusual protein kinase regulating ubiquinone biosynthesis (AarF/ABC1/UbiB family)
MQRKKQLAKILFDMNVKMFLRDNYVHGDMHAGNLIGASASASD